jgi:hypothetical protein
LKKAALKLFFKHATSFLKSVEKGSTEPPAISLEIETIGL